MVLCHDIQGIYILFYHKQMFLQPGCQEMLNWRVQICCYKSEMNALLWQLQGPTLALFAASFSVRERMDVCLELLLRQFSVVQLQMLFLLSNCGLEDTIDVSDFWHVYPGLFFLDLQLKMILSRLCTLLSKCQHVFEAKVCNDHQLTLDLGKMLYTLFLTSESNKQNIMAIAP